jgi:O-antigen/teichoic acid export membrane protein
MAEARFFRSVLVFTATNAVAAGMPLLLLPVLTRLLTPADYGIVAMYATIISAFSALAGLSVHGAVGMRYFDRDTIDFPRFVGNCVFILLATTAVLFLVVLAGGGWIEQFTRVPRNWIMIAVLVCALQFVLQMRLAIYQSAKQAAAFAFLRGGQAVSDAALSLLFVVVFALAWQGRLMGMSLAIGFAGLIALVSMISGGWLRFQWDRDDVGRALHFGLPLVPHAIGGLLLATVDRVLITNLIGVDETGTYMVALQIGMGVYLIADASGRAISPWFIETLKRKDALADYSLARNAILYFLALIVLAGIVGLAGKFIMPFLVGAKFAVAANYIGLAALAQAVGGMYLVTANTVFYHARTLQLSAITISSGLLNAAVSYMLVPRAGIEGAFLANLIAQVYLFVAVTFIAQRLHPLPWMRAIANGLRAERGQ